MNLNNPRVRFAPSPTGPLHIGGVRTALYNYLFARQHQGTFVLRIEDTDQSRYVEGAEAYIKDCLDWLGISVDESPYKGGTYEPYRQSERKHMYAQYVQQLLDEGKAYYAFDTSEELEAMRERLKKARVPDPKYNAVTRTQMRNALTLPQDEVQAMIEKGEPYVIRLKIPKKEEIRLYDHVRGWIMVHSSSLDDKVLMKSDGMPTYHMANVVDDHLMKITHVIRGEEWLPSAPLHVLLYKYLGWEDQMPEFAHLPLILKPDGNGKLSKRDGDLGGFPVFPIEWNDTASGEKYMGFREEGYLPEAMINFLAFLGWNPGGTQEIFTMEELVQAFKTERIGKSGAKFDIDKARWYNAQFIKQKDNEELTAYIIHDLKEKYGIACNREQAGKIAELFKERVTFLRDFATESQFLFQAPAVYDEKVVASKWNETSSACIEAYKDVLAKQNNDISADMARSLLQEVLEEKGVKMGKVMQALRVAVTGKGQGPDLMSIIAFLGKHETVHRIEKALNELGVKQ